MERRLRKLVEPLGAELILPCDVQRDEDLDRIFTATREKFGNVDFVLHSIAYAPIEDLQGPTYNVSRDGFKTAMEISVYSLLTIARRSRDILKPGGSILTLTYLGGEKVIPGYNIMGICKSALESSVEYLANELGPSGFRINALMPARSRRSVRRPWANSTRCSSSIRRFHHCGETSPPRKWPTRALIC